MIQALFLFVFSVFYSPFLNAKEWETVRFGTEASFPPFIYIESSQKLTGFDIELAKELCKRAKLTCSFTTQDFDSLFVALTADKYEALIAGISITDERKKNVLFSNPYYKAPAIFLVPQNSPLTDTSIEEWKGKALGAQSGTTHANFAEEEYGKKGVIIKLYTTQNEANLDLTAGRLDGVISDKLVIMDWLKNNKEGKDCCKIIGSVDDSKYFGEGMGIVFKKKDKSLKDIFDKALQEITEDGTLEKLKLKYLSESIQ